MATFPATTYREAVDLALDSSNQFHRIINESATSTINTASGPIDSLRKALVDNFYFKTPLEWIQGESEIEFNQLRLFSDGYIYFAPSARGNNPIPMGVTPVGDPNWVLSSFNLTENIDNVVQSALQQHVNEADPHSQYVLETQLSSVSSANKIPLANSNGKIDLGWFPDNYLDPVIPYSADIWDETNDTHTSEGITTGVTGVHKNMRRCLLLDDGTVNYYLDANDSDLKEDGTPSVLTGADGQVMVEIQKCWVQAKYIQGGASPIIKWSVSAEPKSGYVLHPAFTRGGTLKYSPELGMWHYINPTEELDYVYVGAYDASVFDTSGGVYIDGLNLDNNTSRVNTVEDKLSSVSGKYPMVGLTRPEFRALASNRGANWENLDFWTHSLTQILFVTEYHDLNTQLVLGDGNVSVSTGYPVSSASQSDSPHSVAGKSNSIGNGSGSVTSTARDTAWMSYRGIENWYGNCWKWVDGVNINDRVYYVSNAGSYTDNTSVGYTQLGVAAPEGNGYIRQVQINTLSFIPLSVSGGTSSIAFSDYYYQNTGWRPLLVGGNALSGVGAGGFRWNASNSAADRSRLIGSRLVYKKKL